MPAEAVAATATYEDVISGEKYTVTAYGPLWRYNDNYSGNNV